MYVSCVYLERLQMQVLASTYFGLSLNMLESDTPLIGHAFGCQSRTTSVLEICVYITIGIDNTKSWTRELYSKM